MSKRHRIDTVILALALFVSTGAVLAYNIYSSDGGGVSVSLSDLLAENTKASLISECAAANLETNSTVSTSGSPTPTFATLPPIVTPPTE